MTCVDKNGHKIMAGDGVNIKKGFGRGIYPYMVRTVTGDTFTDTRKDKLRQCNQYTLEPIQEPHHTASHHTASGVRRTMVPVPATRQLAPHELNQSVRHITSLLQPLSTFSKEMSSKERTRVRTRIILNIGNKINDDSETFEINEKVLAKRYYKAMETKYKDLFNENYVAVRYDGKTFNGGGIKNKKRKKRKKKSNYKNTKRKNTKRKNTKRKNTKRKNTKRKKKSNYKNSF
jgi:hypothetical protein